MLTSSASSSIISAISAFVASSTFFSTATMVLSVSPIKSPCFISLPSIFVSLTAYVTWPDFILSISVDIFFSFSPTLLFPTKFIIAEIPCGMFLDGMTIKFLSSVSCFACSAARIILPLFGSTNIFFAFTLSTASNISSVLGFIV